MHGTADLANARMADHSRYARQVALRSQARPPPTGPPPPDNPTPRAGTARVAPSFSAAPPPARI